MSKKLQDIIQDELQKIEEEKQKHPYEEQIRKAVRRGENCIRIEGSESAPKNANEDEFYIKLSNLFPRVNRDWFNGYGHYNVDACYIYLCYFK